jgi:hypothetical protein
MALDFVNLEGYELHPKKSVAINIRGNNKQCETTNEKLNMGNITMPEVEQATHLGIPVLLTLMFPIFSPILTSCKRSNSVLIYSL